MTTGQRVPVTAPPPIAPVLGLRTSALAPPDGPLIGDGNWSRGFAYAPENHSLPTFRGICDQTSVDAPGIGTPVATAVPNATGGTLAAGTYTYRVTAINANGETTPSPETTATEPALTTAGSVTISWTAIPGASSYRVYGRTAGGELGMQTTTATTFTDTGAITPAGAMPAANTTGGSGNYGNLPIVGFDPYLIEAEDECSAFGFEERDYMGRAQRLLEAVSTKGLEMEFATGALAQKAGYTDNNYLRSARTTVLTPAAVPSVARGREILEDAIASQGYGGNAMIHLQPQNAPQLLDCRRVGPYLLSNVDTRIVPGVGYDGLGPAGQATPAGTAWLYATDMVTVRLGDIHVLPTTLAEALDRGAGGQPNRIRFRAYRAAAATFDGAVQFAVLVNLDT